VDATRHRLLHAAIAEVDGPLHAVELRFVLLFLDAVNDLRPDAATERRRLAGQIPPDGVLPVEGEAMHPLVVSPSRAARCAPCCRRRRSAPTSTASRRCSKTTADG
jgi:hypothetical protein